jgi:hypothetical protein
LHKVLASVKENDMKTILILIALSCAGCTVVKWDGGWYFSLFNKIEDAVVIVDANEIYAEFGKREPTVPVEVLRLIP